MDIIDLIDEVTAPTCGQCGTTLRPDGPSAEFCDEHCQESWHQSRIPPPSSLLDRLTPDGRAALEAAADRLGLADSPWSFGYATGDTVPSRLGEGIRGSTPTPSCTLDSVRELLVQCDRDCVPRPSVLRLTHQQFADLTMNIPVRADGGHLPDGTRLTSRGPLYGIPIEIVDRYEDSTIGVAQTAPAPTTAMLIGGQRHGRIINVPNPPRHRIDFAETVIPNRILFDADLTRGVEYVHYDLIGHNGTHWCYVDTRPAAPTRTVNGALGALTVRFHRQDFQRLTSWVTISDPRRGVVCELPDELVYDDAAVVALFTERGRSDDVPPARRRSRPYDVGEPWIRSPITPPQP